MDTVQLSPTKNLLIRHKLLILIRGQDMLVQVGVQTLSNIGRLQIDL